MTNATLALEDGTVLTGCALGARADTVFELVFNTSMTGYQEILTDPSYRGQGVLFTTAHIGNTGINPEDNESAVPQVSAVVLREASPVVSNWRAVETLQSWLDRYGVPGITEVDTRSLTRKLRDGGSLRAALSTRGASAAELLEMARAWPGLDGRDMVSEVSIQSVTPWSADPGSAWLPNPARSAAAPHIVLYDFGAKRNIARHLAALGLRVTIVPSSTTCAQVLSLQPSGVLLSNGPGDPAGLPGIVAEVRSLLDTGLPIFGICLGHQLIGRAIGGRTHRLKFGHHSGNHPVLDLATGKVQVTAQNHNYAVAIDSLDPSQVEITHISLNDRTLEGMALKNRPVFSVQYHPEAAPGPHDAHGLFSRFLNCLSGSLSSVEMS